MGHEREGVAHRHPPRGRAQGPCQALWALAYTSSSAPALAPGASRGACGRGLDYGARLHTACHAAPGLQERDELALGLRIPFDVALRHGETGMARKLLHVPQTAPDLRDFACGAGNKGAAPGMRRTAVHL